VTTSVRAEIILALKDEMSKPLAQAGKTGAGAMGDFKKGAQGMVQELTGVNLASVGVAGAMIGLASGIKFAVSEAMEAEKIMALTESTIKATGGAAGLTAGQIGQMAMRLSLLNAIDDETIQSAENLMLTFKKVKGDAFEPAMQAAIDLSVIMGTDLKSSTMMLGKALEDPVRGITALRRAGVSFTADQQKLIKSLVETGQAAEAQAMILAELNSQVGGAGAAAANTLSGQMEEVKIQFGNVAQMAGTLLIPAIGGVVDGFMFGTQVAGKLNLTLQYMLGIIDEEQAALRGAALEAGDLTAVYTEQEPAVQNLTNSTAAYYGELTQTNTALETSGVVASTTGAYYQDLARNVDALYTVQEKLTIGLRGYTEELLFNQAAQGLDAESALRLGIAMGVVDESAIIAAESVEELKNKYDANRDGALSAAEASRGYLGEILQLQSAINNMQDKTVTVRVVTMQEYVSTPGVNGTGGGRAAGGPVVAGTSYIVGERGPEMFTPTTSGNITPNDKLMGDDSAAVLDEIRTLVANLPRAMRDAVQKA
jgi:hypothetical protein